jgi:hypothetical protein
MPIRSFGLWDFDRDLNESLSKMTYPSRDIISINHRCLEASHLGASWNCSQHISINPSQHAREAEYNQVSQSHSIVQKVIPNHANALHILNKALRLAKPSETDIVQCVVRSLPVVSTIGQPELSNVML